MVQFYRQDIISNQKLQVISGIKPIERIVRGSSSLFSVISNPYKGWKKAGSRGAVVGLVGGFERIYTFLSDETSDAYVYLIGKKWKH